MGSKVKSKEIKNKQLTMDHLPEGIFRKVRIMKVATIWAVTFGVVIEICNIILFSQSVGTGLTGGVVPLILAPPVFVMPFALILTAMSVTHVKSALDASRIPEGAATNKLLYIVLLASCGPAIWMSLSAMGHSGGWLNFDALFLFFARINMLFVVLALAIAALKNAAINEISAWRRSIQKRGVMPKRIRKSAGEVVAVLTAIGHVILALAAFIILYATAVSRGY
ncbi:MAG: hypothetical protein Q4A37_01585 [Candidatus Saccharibacteria bacterium]|nr:hypothetical protein [Candidatus Saccharibacteria bacterium]